MVMECPWGFQRSEEWQGGLQGALEHIHCVVKTADLSAGAVGVPTGKTRLGDSENER